MAENRALSTGRAERVRDFLDASQSANTKRSYDSHWKDFNEYCELHGYKALPADVAAIADYLTLLATIGAKFSTIQVKAAAISFKHRAAKFPNPMLSIEIKEIMKGIRRKIGTRQQGKEPLRLDDLKKLIGVLPSDLVGVRDKAILLVGFGGAFRRSELAAITFDYVEFRRDKVIITLPYSKTDQEGQGMTKVLPVLNNKEICPVTALKAWIQAAKISAGFVFRSIGRKAGEARVLDRGLNPQQVAFLIKRYAHAAGLNDQVLSGHSLRAGYVTEAADRDVAMWKIKQQTGHKSDVILQHYIRNRGKGGESATKTAFGE